jgi:putative oxidoreductase
MPERSTLLDGMGYDTAARILLVMLFPPSAVDKIVHWNLALEQANSSFLPDGGLLLIIGMVIEIVCPVLIVFRRFDASASAVLALFCAATAILYHNFWAYPGLFAPQGGPALDQLWEFLKNFAIVGGLMFVMRDGRWLR